MDIEILGEILKGGAEKVKESGAVVIGGHSIIDEEIKFGMAVTGVIHPDKILRNVGVQEGDALILTKPLGTGIITTALKKGKASEESVNEAVKSMITLNAAASQVARKHPIHACSDVTGFGILGHCLEMASGSGVTLVIESAKMPLLRGAPRLAEKGYITGGCKRNREYLADKMAIDKSIREGLVEVALDPQTSGGLLLAVSKRFAPKLLDDLHAAGIVQATEIGYATSLQKSWVRLV
jgi:selenide, water dikinase